MRKIFFFISFFFFCFSFAENKQPDKGSDDLQCAPVLGKINYDREWFEKEFNPKIDKVLESTSTVIEDYSLNDIFSALCCLVVIFYIGRICASQLLRGGDTAFNFDELRRPFFILIAILCWGYFDQFVRETLTESVSVYVKEKEEEIGTKAGLSFTDALCMIEKLQQKFENENEAMIGDAYWFDKINIYLQKIPIMIQMSIAWGCFKIMAFIDYLLMIGFTIFAKIWLYLVGLGGGIAFTASVFSGGWSPLITWSKTYISVSLWVVVAGICMCLVNGIGASLFNDYIIEQVSYMIAKGWDGTVEGWTALSVNVVSTLLWGVVMIFLLVVLKIILLSKVPVIINTWIPGGNAAGAGFSAAFLPLSLVKEVASSALNAGMMAATGGIGGGKMGGGLKGQ